MKTFDRHWFAQHQTRLLWWLNSPLTRRWFRWVLCITPNDIGHRRPIVAIHPHAYVVLNETGATLTADIRSDDKFARRLYSAFRPLWWTLHAWDWLIADRFVPRLAYGFDTLTAYALYAYTDEGGTAKHGHIRRHVADTTWSNVHDGPGTHISTTAFEGQEDADAVFWLQAGVASGWSLIGRLFLSFNTALLGGGATVISGSVSLYGRQWGNSTELAEASLALFRASPSDSNALVIADYGECGDEAQSGVLFTSGSWNDDGYNNFTLNALGRAHINLSGLTSWCFREATYDAPDVEPTITEFPEPPLSPSGASASAYMPNRAGTIEDPKLILTYTPAITSVATQIDVYTDPGPNTWTKPSGARWVEVHLVAAGGGGGSGRKGAVGTVRSGGGGGGAGSHCALRLPAIVLGAEETVIIGAAGAGGAQQEGNSSDGNAGTAGGNTTFGTHALAKGGAGGEGGNTGLTNGGDGYQSFPGTSSPNEGDGGLCIEGQGRTPSNSLIRAGGGGGGGLDAANTAYAGGNGGSVGGAGNQSGYGGVIAGGAGGAAGVSNVTSADNGINGTNAPDGSWFGGGGGGGGGSGQVEVGEMGAAEAGDGGRGGFPGGGGGGGGATPQYSEFGINTASGVGGAGADGFAIVVTYF